MDDVRTPGGVLVRGKALRTEVARSGGPGGQHVNVTASKVTLVLDVGAGLPAEVADKVRDRFGPTLRTSSSTHRSQHRNRVEALERLLRRVDEALVEPTERTATRVPPRERRRRTRDKKARARCLSDRRIPGED